MLTAQQLTKHVFNNGDLLLAAVLISFVLDSNNLEPTACEHGIANHLLDLKPIATG